MAKKSNLSEFKSLKKIWYQKLEDSGFVDLEQSETHWRTYRHDGSKKYGKYSREWNNSKIEYYNMAVTFLNDYDFETPLDQAIWEYHANGISVRDITETLKKANIQYANRMTVWRTVNRLRSEMKEMYLIK